MIQNTLSELSSALRQLPSVKPETKAELLGLISTLEREVDELSKTHAADARSIAAFTGLSAHEATKDQKNPATIRAALQGLSASVAGFEQSHPRLFAAVDRVCAALSNMGI